MQASLLSKNLAQALFGAKKLFDQAPLELTAPGRALFGKKTVFKHSSGWGEIPGP